MTIEYTKDADGNVTAAEWWSQQKRFNDNFEIGQKVYCYGEFYPRIVEIGAYWSNSGAGTSGRHVRLRLEGAEAARKHDFDERELAELREELAFQRGERQS